MAARPNVETMVSNMELVYAEGTKTEIFSGLAWYPEAFLKVQELAARRGIHPLVAAAVVAAVSPQTRWLYKGVYRNLELAEAMIVLWQSGKEVRGHTADVTAKVRSILECGSIDPAVLVVYVLGKEGFKTGNFFLNLAGIRSLQGVNHKFASTLRGTTTDRFHIGCAYGRYFGDNVPGLSAKQYNEISEATEIFAARHGFTTEEAQAILWVIFRRLHNVRDE